MEQVLIRAVATSLNVSDPAFGDTGISLLQAWSVESGGYLFLCEVQDAAAAKDWLKNQQALGHVTSAEFVRTL
ncbi:hypothetical protein [Pseudogemmobacter faecipullorum]|uniref:Uncharacterized protein n=1 Tax=Pseudogemmobacter faecipullorum TaxID=2755041 RepID=A0ABS8CH45_9RHOB|nr:hypothetical protein [Pseudogemmobacter faecipullorum]MCB5408679.1 hypothetical protein [Pseudogemmobacter faecipullorum]